SFTRAPTCQPYHAGARLCGAGAACPGPRGKPDARVVVRPRARWPGGKPGRPRWSAGSWGHAGAPHIGLGTDVSDGGEGDDLAGPARWQAKPKIPRAASAA